MFAVIAGAIFIIGSCVGWIDKAISVQHLIAIGFIAMVFLCAHLAFRVWAPERRW
jgi:membrane-bound acyltransferase YfiQ involved in biofilm formation